MGDMPEPKYHSTDRDNTSVMSRVSATLGRNFIRTKDFQDAQIMSQMETEGYGKAIATGTSGKQRSIRHKLVSLTLKRKNKLGDDVRRKLQVRWIRSSKRVKQITGTNSKRFTLI